MRRSNLSLWRAGRAERARLSSRVTGSSTGPFWSYWSRSTSPSGRHSLSLPSGILICSSQTLAREVIHLRLAGAQRRGREFRRIAIPPNERVRIQQELHASRPSQNSSGKGASKSGAACHAPACRPAHRTDTELDIPAPFRSRIQPSRAARKAKNCSFCSVGRASAAASISARVLTR